MSLNPVIHWVERYCIFCVFYIFMGKQATNNLSTVGGNKMAVQGTGYVGSNKMESSIPNEEIVPESPSDWSYGYRLYKFAFMNNTECTITINKQTDIFLQAGQGFQIDRYDLPITSFKIRESGVLYNWSAAY